MSEDLIRRSDAIKAFVEETNGVNVEKAIREVDAYLKIRECDEVWDSIRAIRDCLECAKDEIAEYIPSADIPQGEWIRTGRTNIYGGIEVQCSNCGDKVMVQHLEDEWFCRHCGADMGMKGADDETD